MFADSSMNPDVLLILQAFLQTNGSCKQEVWCILKSSIVVCVEEDNIAKRGRGNKRACRITKKLLT